jgi:hypothetical protein
VIKLQRVYIYDGHVSNMQMSFQWTTYKQSSWWRTERAKISGRKLTAGDDMFHPVACCGSSYDARRKITIKRGCSSVSRSRSTLSDVCGRIAPSCYNHNKSLTFYETHCASSAVSVRPSVRHIGERPPTVSAIMRLLSLTSAMHQLSR